MRRWRDRIFYTDAPAATLLVRLIVGAVFLSEGLQKFLFLAPLGIGRFATIDLPAPYVLGLFTGFWELLCGALFILGLGTRLAAIPMIIDILVAIATTKLPILRQQGFWAMAHEARTDWSMLLGSLFLLLVGAGSLSVDAILTARKDGRTN